MQSDEFVTFFYNKRTGSLKNYCTGKQDMSSFGDEQQDYELILDFIVVPRDADAKGAMHSKGNYAVNVLTKEIEIKAEAIPKYKVKPAAIK